MKNGVKQRNLLRVLVVEDDEPTLEAIILKFKAANISADFAGDGIEGLRKLRNGGFSCVLLDLHMPKGNGFVFMEEKNKDNVTCDIPVIIFSNFSQPEFINRALGLGVKGYLIKSQHSVEDIIDEVKKCVETGQCLIDR